MFTKDKSIERLQRQLSQIDRLKQIKFPSPEFKQWHRDTKVAITKIFGEGSKNVEDFTEVRYEPQEWALGPPGSAYQKRYCEGFDQAAAVLKSMISEIEEYWSEEIPDPLPHQPMKVVERLCSRFHLASRQLLIEFRQTTNDSAKPSSSTNLKD